MSSQRPSLVPRNSVPRSTVLQPPTQRPLVPPPARLRRLAEETESEEEWPLVTERQLEKATSSGVRVGEDRAPSDVRSRRDVKAEGARSLGPDSSGSRKRASSTASAEQADGSRSRPRTGSPTEGRSVLRRRSHDTVHRSENLAASASAVPADGVHDGGRREARSDSNLLLDVPGLRESVGKSRPTSDGQGPPVPAAAAPARGRLRPQAAGVNPEGLPEASGPPAAAAPADPRPVEAGAPPSPGQETEDFEMIPTLTR